MSPKSKHRLVVATSTKKKHENDLCGQYSFIKQTLVNCFLGSRHTEVSNTSMVSAFRKLQGYIRWREHSAYNICNYEDYIIDFNDSKMQNGRYIYDCRYLNMWVYEPRLQCKTEIKRKGHLH